MAIKDIQPKQSNVTVEADIVEKGPVREFQKFGKPGKVCTAKIKDESGSCSLSLWNEQIDSVNVGDRIKLTDGYSTEWQGNIQVTSGRNGKIEVIGKADAKKPDPKKPSLEESEEEFSDIEEEVID
jgi:replication factor A1